MNSRAFTLSLIIAAVAMFMVWSYIDGREAQFVEEYGEPKPVLVAKKDIRELDLIDDRVVQIENVPHKFLQPGALQKVEEVYNTYAAVPILKGEQITKPRITQPGSRTGLASQVAVGKRALSIRVSEEKAVAKLIKPGDRVDVIATIDYTGGKKDQIKVKTILQDILVLSTGLKVTNALSLIKVGSGADQVTKNLNEYTGFNTVTLELTPFEIQKITLLENLGGDVRLSLRNNDDKAIERISATRLFDVLGEDAGDAKAYFAEQAERSNARKGRQ